MYSFLYLLDKIEQYTTRKNKTKHQKIFTTRKRICWK